MTPQDFITRWRGSTLTERAGSQSHFKDLCRLLGVKEPYEDDATDADFAFEKGAAKTGGGDGWADVWKRGCFAWEYKGKRKNLEEALKQLKLYQGALHNPPLLIVSDMDRIEVHTSWTNMVQETHVFTLDDLLDARNRDRLKAAFSETSVEIFKPNQKRADLTKEVAEKFVELAQRLRSRGHPPEAVAHFVNRMVFCMFAEDVKLLPDKLFTKLLQVSAPEPDQFRAFAERLFAQMRTGGSFDLNRIEWFNGGLFDDDTALPLERADIRLALEAAEKDWSNIDPSIMGTLFERGLDPDKRSQLGAHYTDPEKIMMIVNPVIVEPLTREWESAKARIAEELEKSRTAKSSGAKTQAHNRAREQQTLFLEKLNRFRVLDPACGSGNFLYLALKALKDIEHRANTECEELGLPRVFPAVGPENMLGIEINPFAAELARVSVWVGEIQWMREHGFDVDRQPILKSMENIVCHDALLNEDGSEYEWPEADVIIGNPPFLGDKLMIGAMGEDYVRTLRKAFEGRVPGGADLVCYWFAKAREALEVNKKGRAGLVSTNSIRGGANRVVLDDIVEAGRLFEAWSDEEWVPASRNSNGNHAAVRVSLICFDMQDGGDLQLDGAFVGQINSDLTASEANLTRAVRLADNYGQSIIGRQKDGPLDVPGEIGRRLATATGNPHGRPNWIVVRPWRNGLDVVRRHADSWLIDFMDMDEREAALFEAPFEYVKEHVKPIRATNRDPKRRSHWWRPGRTGNDLRSALQGHSRYIATPRVAKHRLFVWLDSSINPDCQLVVIARHDDTSFGILHSRMHELWSLGLGTWLGVGNDPRYTPSTTFETFPFPEGLTPNIPAEQYAGDPRAQAIAAAAKRLNELRETWLNPPDLIVREPEVVPAYPDRILPKNEEAAKELKKRTLTNLYNQRPAWLAHAHRDLDAAVAAAYGWTDWDRDAGLPDDVILERLFRLNQERAAAGR